MVQVLPKRVDPRCLALGLLIGAGLVAGPLAAQSVDSAAGRPGAPAGAPLPRLGLRLSAGRDFANGSSYYNISPLYWLGFEANRWLARRLTVGAATIALVPIGRHRPYNYTGFFQGHITYTFIHERPFSLNVRAGIFGALNRSKQERFCDFDCTDVPPRFNLVPGWVLGLHPTFPLNKQWSLDGTVEVRAMGEVPGNWLTPLIGLGAKLRLLKPATPPAP